jgi:DNA-binding NtrC family response regulator
MCATMKGIASMADMGRVLVVEDADAERRSISQVLQREGFTVFSAGCADKALGYIGESIDVVLSDQFLGSATGVDLLLLWKKQRPRTQFIIMTSQGSIPAAVEAIKGGACDYVCKPLTHGKLVLMVHHAVEGVRKSERFRWGGDSPAQMQTIVGQSRQITEVRSRIQRAAPVDTTVLILGENGTGKELVAEALHHQSQRRSGPFVAVNVAAVPATLVESELFGHVRGAFTGATDSRTGRFEQADGGTLFIDEIGDFDLALQPKLLRVVETLTLTPVGGQENVHVNVRVVAATSRDIEKMVREGKFREDLYYRLNVVRITLPPLRQRPEDIVPLVEHFVAQIVEGKNPVGRTLSPQVMRRLLDYQWPGNVRELRNTLESMMVLADGETVTESDLPAHILHAAGDAEPGGHVPVGLTMEELEKLAIIRMLATCGDNRTHAAERLGISVRTLQRKLIEYQIGHQ